MFAHYNLLCDDGGRDRLWLLGKAGGFVVLVCVEGSENSKRNLRCRRCAQTGTTPTRQLHLLSLLHVHCQTMTRCRDNYLALTAVFLGSSVALMLGRTPPEAMVTPPSSLFSSSSLRTASWT